MDKVTSGLVWFGEGSWDGAEMWVGSLPKFKKNIENFDFIITAVTPWEYEEISHLFSSKALAPGQGHLYVNLDDSDVSEQQVANIRHGADVAYTVFAQSHKVLVHCQQGWNRSGVIVARAMMMGRWSADQAIAAVRKVRGPSALCNEAFVNWLKSEEE